MSGHTERIRNHFEEKAARYDGIIIKLIPHYSRMMEAVVRSPEKLAHLAHYGEKLILIEREIQAMSREELGKFLKDCDGAASCLGHNLTLKGLFGRPRRLVTDAARLICSAFPLSDRSEPAKFVLMNTTGNRDRRLDEKACKAKDRLLLAVLRILLPPQADNGDAALYLQKNFTGKDKPISWKTALSGKTGREKCP